MQEKKKRRQTGGETDKKTTPGQKTLKYLVGFSEQLDQRHTAAQTAVLKARHMFSKPVQWPFFMGDFDMSQQEKHCY